MCVFIIVAKRDLGIHAINKLLIIFWLVGGLLVCDLKLGSCVVNVLLQLDARGGGGDEGEDRELHGWLLSFLFYFL